MNGGIDEDEAFATAVLDWLRIHGPTVQALGPHPSYFWFVLGTNVGRFALDGRELPIEAALQLVNILRDKSLLEKTP